MKLKTIILGLAFLFLFSMFSCGNAVENKSDEGNIATATIRLEDGRQLDFKTTLTSNATVMDRKFGIGFTNSLNGVMIYMMIMSNETLVPGTHDGYLNVRQIGSSNFIDEKYDSHSFKEANTNREGNSKLTITSMENDRIQGTFSGTLFSKTGKKLTIKDGVFNVKTEKKL